VSGLRPTSASRPLALTGRFGPTTATSGHGVSRADPELPPTHRVPAALYGLQRTPEYLNDGH